MQGIPGLTANICHLGMTKCRLAPTALQTGVASLKSCCNTGRPGEEGADPHFSCSQGDTHALPGPSPPGGIPLGLLPAQHETDNLKIYVLANNIRHRHLQVRATELSQTVRRCWLSLGVQDFCLCLSAMDYSSTLQASPIGEAPLLAIPLPPTHSIA